MNKTIVITTAMIGNKAYWRAHYLGDKPDRRIVGKTVREVVGALVYKEFNLVFTDEAKKRLASARRGCGFKINEPDEDEKIATVWSFGYHLCPVN